MAPAILKVILGDNSSQRLTFHCGLPGSVIELIEEVQRQCGLNNSNFRLQFMDPLFGNEFMSLTSMDEIQDRGTIRMTSLAEGLTTQSAEADEADASCIFVWMIPPPGPVDVLIQTYSHHQNLRHPAHQPLGHCGQGFSVFLSFPLMQS